jgi:hypothetical protein
VSTADHPVPSGESPLEERLRTFANSRVTMEDIPDESEPWDICGWCGGNWPEHDPDCPVCLASEALDELTRLTAEVARLNELCKIGEHNVEDAEAGQAVAEAEAARLTADLEEWEQTAIHLLARAEAAEAAVPRSRTTEGGDRADD